MQGFLNYIFESAIIMAVFYLVYILLLRHDKNFIFNRWYLLVTPLLSSVIPQANISLQSPFLKNGLVQTIYLPSVIIGDLAPVSPAIVSNWLYVAAILYGTGLVFFSWRSFLQIQGFFKIIADRSSKNLDQSRFRLIHTDGRIPTGSFLNYIFYDNSKDLNEDQKHQILLHEEAHIAQRHSYDLLYLEIFGIIFWFNPLIRLIRKELLAVHEFLADEAVTAITENKESYLSVLASQTLNSLNLSFYNQFNTSQIFMRMNMLKSNRKRPLIWNLFVTVPIVAVLLVVFGCENQETTGDVVGAQNIRTEEVIFEETEFNDQLAGEVYTVVDQMPGGIEALYGHIMKNIKYPDEAKKMGIEGKVFVQFIVDKNGNVANVHAVKGIGAGCDEEAVKVVKSSPNFKPGIKDDQAVNTMMVLPITFKLDSKDNTKKAQESTAPNSSKKDDAKSVTVVGYKE